MTLSHGGCDGRLQAAGEDGTAPSRAGHTAAPGTSARVQTQRERRLAGHVRPHAAHARVSVERRGVRLPDDADPAACRGLRQHPGRHGSDGAALRLHQGEDAGRASVSPGGPDRRERRRQRRQHAAAARLHERTPRHRRHAPGRPLEVRHRLGRPQPDGLHAAAARLQVRQLRVRPLAGHTRLRAAESARQRVLLQRLPVAAAESRPARRLRTPEGARGADPRAT